MTPTRLLIFLVVILQAPGAWAAPWGAWRLAVADGHPTAQLDLVQVPQGDPTGPQGEKYEAEKRQSQWSLQVLKELLKELDKAHVMDQKVLQKGDSRAAPISDEETRAMQSPGVPVRSNPGEARFAGMDNSFPQSPGVDGTRNANAKEPTNFWKYCTEGIMAILGTMLFGMGLCWGICLWRERKKRLAKAKALKAQPSFYY